MIKVQSVGNNKYHIEVSVKNEIPTTMTLDRGDAIELYCRMDVLFDREKKEQRAAEKANTDKELAAAKG